MAAAPGMGNRVSGSMGSWRREPFRHIGDLRHPSGLVHGPKARTPLGTMVSPWLYADRKSTRLNSSHLGISYAVFCLKKKKTRLHTTHLRISYPGFCLQHITSLRR